MHLMLRLRSRSLARLAYVVVALLAVGSIALSFGTTSPAHAAVGDCTPGSNWGTINASFESQVLTLVNQHRAALGLGALSNSPTLTNSAHWKSLHMAFYAYMQHDDPAPPVGRTVSDRLAACGYPIGTVSWGENIAYGYATPQDVMNAWLNSPGHRANIENASYRAIGIGAAQNASGVIYWTQDFGSLVDAGTPPPPPPPPSVNPPTVTLTATPGSSTTSTSASFAWTTANSPTSTSCSLDNAPASPCSSPQAYSSLAVGTHSFLVTVGNSGGSNSAAFSWTVTSPTPAPTVSGISPTSGPAGTSVTISGSGFSGATGVTFNGVPASFTVASPSSITTTVPAGATTGPMVVTGPAGSASAGTFTVTALAKPDFTLSVSPSSGSISRVSTMSYTATISRSGGFTGSVQLGVSGLPSRTTASWSSNPVPSGGATSTLRVSVNRRSLPGTYTLTITGTGGGISRSAQVTLIVQ